MYVHARKGCLIILQRVHVAYHGVFCSLERQWRYRPSSAAAPPRSDTNSNIYRIKKKHIAHSLSYASSCCIPTLLLQSPFSALNLSQLSFRVANTMAAISRASVLAVWGSYGTN